ncbi:type II toxin-antitoxin system PemK/MazF family toxin [Eisenbergiella tayi]|uniref:type II toxin-antitoxin system PemK/MazF family toxin n=1 Tax=Eisenbergiella tayi TaxID=1432052 RepID=UPI00084964A2|nr:type II toxin-antitoxin system PemK/MazF family toxin [Eisenbergiella tayi]ODR36221.1 hypothetical protein BEI60_13295 [Eisenbergiella tayi]
MLNVDFQALRNIIRDKSNKSKNAVESAVCLREFMNLLENILENNKCFKQDEAANFIMSIQNWLIRRCFTSCKDVNIGDIFYADLGINYKPEFSYHHPVIILEDVGNVVMVVPVSTTESNVSEAYHPLDNPEGSKLMRKVYGKEKGQESDGFEKTGAILLTDVKTISKGRLISKKGRLKDINNDASLFREIKKSVFKLCFPKENINMYKLMKENEKLQSENEKLKTEYNRLTDELTKSEKSR